MANSTLNIANVFAYAALGLFLWFFVKALWMAITATPKGSRRRMIIKLDEVKRVGIDIHLRKMLIPGSLGIDTETRRLSIMIDNEQSLDEMRLTLCHELVHAILYQYGVPAPHDEDVVEEIGHVVFQVMRTQVNDENGLYNQNTK